MTSDSGSRTYWYIVDVAFDNPAFVSCWYDGVLYRIRPMWQEWQCLEGRICNIQTHNSLTSNSDPSSYTSLVVWGEAFAAQITRTLECGKKSSPSPRHCSTQELQHLLVQDQYGCGQQFQSLWKMTKMDTITWLSNSFSPMCDMQQRVMKQCC